MNELVKLVNFKTKKINLDKLIERNFTQIFDEKIINFLDQVSRNIFLHKNIRDYPDLASLGFFCRKKNINLVKKKYQRVFDTRYGRGISLHFAPSNVPLNFAYSMLSGLLAGNKCLIRLSSKNFPQADIFINIIKRILIKKEYCEIINFITIFQYEKNAELTDYLSKICDIRIIWGGDLTISELRKSELKSHSFDITFADRYSVCLINAKKYLSEKNFRNEALAFFNDTLFFDQNACTSPKLIYWHGKSKEINKAKTIFWENFENIISEKNYILSGNTIIDKLVSQQQAAIDIGVYNGIKKEKNSFCMRSQIKNIPKNIEKYFSPGGFFLEYSSDSLVSLYLLNSQKLQTITCIGFDAKDVKKNINYKKIMGVDRIVKNGRASEFSFVWDGYDLIYQMSKEISIL